MPMNTLQTGKQETLTQNVTYALPPVAAQFQSTAVCEISITSSSSGFAAVAATTTGTTLAGGWIRCTTASPVAFINRFN